MSARMLPPPGDAAGTDPGAPGALVAASGWLPSPTGPLAARLTTPAFRGATGSTWGVVVLPAVGYDSSSAYRTTRALAEELARRGASVLRVDYAGTGDSDGAGGDLSLAGLRGALPPAAAFLRTLGVSRLTVVGLQLGAIVALLGAAGVGADEVLAWAPALPMRQYLRALRMLGVPAPPVAGLGDGVILGGHPFPAALIRDLASTDLGEQDLRGVRRLVVVERDDRLSGADLLDAGRAAGAEVVHLRLPGHDSFLDCSAEDSTVPRALVAALADALAHPLPDDAPPDVLPTRGRDPGPGAQPPVPAPSLGSVATIANAGGAVLEEHVVLGRRALVGVRTRPTTIGRHPVLVLLNSGSDPHHGPGRAWVDLARGLAPHGVEVLRVDFSGWGDSPPDPRGQGRPYDLHTLDDLDDLVATLRSDGAPRVVLAGLCSGAWLALHAARTLTVDGVLALNPQLYWRPGDPVEALMADTRRRRAGEIAWIHATAATGRWDAEDAAGLLPPEGQWLQELHDRGVPVDLLFAEGDDGIVHLRDRLRRRVDALQAGGLVTVTELPEVDHSLTRTWLRGRVVEALTAALRRQGALMAVAR